MASNTFPLQVLHACAEKMIFHLRRCLCRGAAAAAATVGLRLRIGAAAAPAAVAEAALDGRVGGDSGCKGARCRAAALRLRKRLCACTV